MTALLSILKRAPLAAGGKSEMKKRRKRINFGHCNKLSLLTQIKWDQ
jgi:hypothetical protein